MHCTLPCTLCLSLHLFYCLPILTGFKQVLGLGHLEPGEVLSNTSSTTTEQDKQQYHEPEPEQPASVLLEIEGQCINPNKPEPPLILDPLDAPIEQPPAGIHLAIMAQVGPQAPVSFAGIPQQQPTPAAAQAAPVAPAAQGNGGRLSGNPPFIFTGDCTLVKQSI